MGRFLKFAALGVVVAFGAVLAAIISFRLSLPAATDPPEGDQFDIGALFVTNREARPEAPPGERFSGARGTLAWGRCQVRFSPIPMADDVARAAPFFVPTDIRDVVSVEVLDEPSFQELIDEPARVVVYVHGYAYGFARNCRMGAELQRMLAEQATVVLFSWPSDANPVEYVADQVDVEWSVPDLARTLRSLAERYGQIDLVAHSLGSRGVIQALHSLEGDREGEPLIRRLVLLAPDFDAGSFGRQLAALRPAAEEIALYASDLDAPLVLSATLHGQPRLGQGGQDLTVLPGVTTIDVSPVGRYRPSGHEYFYYHPLVAADLVAHLAGQPAGDRPNLVAHERDGLTYYALVPPRGDP